MSYQIKQLASLAGVSVRTLRYYDQIGLLKPARVGANGYRYYEAEQVDRLQRICLYRAMRLPLAEIGTLLTQPITQQVASLQHQYQNLLQEREHLDKMLVLIQTTIQTQREDVTMTDETKFKAFKDAALTQNEADYGKELRATYDESTLQAANTKFANLSAADYQQMTTVETELIKELKHGLTVTNLDDTTAQRIYTLHRQWLGFTWPKYSAAMHRGLAEMYLADHRFQKYYDDRAGAGATALLVQSIRKNAHD
ncbi:MerR family transcriptional regulator [Lactiplantibacillus garii]|uniref:MerR family transcriptional regulator n=1 Tax=Lactiplantibacillus garii TaxID=2306423 RepID=A0A3R8LLE7_9LACO|nr:MerR family transcriptional regulator [Lactiplantibacillus garii]RRK11373.1 MerR family transcriptional regulator [Lactiplantibacillus garii]